MSKVFVLLVFVLFSCSKNKLSSNNPTQKPAGKKDEATSTSGSGSGTKDVSDTNDADANRSASGQSDPSMNDGIPSSTDQGGAQKTTSDSSTKVVKTCQIDDEATIYLDLSRNAPKYHHYNNLAMDLEFNSDAFDFKMALIGVVVDDGKPIIQIGGQKVFEAFGSGRAQIHQMNKSLNGLLKGGKNLVQGSFYDEEGEDAKLSLKLRGSWSTYQKDCFKDFNHRYTLP
jgi:hypothetical protein